MLRKRLFGKGHFRQENNNAQEPQSEGVLFRKILIRLGIVLAVLLAMYFWGLAIISNIDTFWKTLSLSSSSQTVEQNKGITPLTPRLNSLPVATKEPTMTIGGYAESGLVVKLYINDVGVASIVADKEGTFSFEGITLSEGSNRIYDKGTSDGGLDSRPSRILNVAYRSKPPLLNVYEPSDRQSFNQKESEINISGKTEPSITVRFNDYQVVVDDQGNFKGLYSLKEGENQVSVVAEDIAGNKTTVYRTVYFNRVF